MNYHLLSFLLLFNACSNVTEKKSEAHDTLHTASPIQQGETEEEELQRITSQRHLEDSTAFAELNIYNGEYTLITEDPEPYTLLKLNYVNDRIFDFELTLRVTDTCDGTIKGQIFMDRTQHGYFDNEDCPLHFEFNGSRADFGMVIEILQNDSCSPMTDNCSISGTYSTEKPK